MGRLPPASCAVAWLLLAGPAPGQAAMAEQVNRAIDRGVEWLKTQQRPDGSFPCDHRQPVGATALSTYALLKSGVLASDPVVQKAIGFLRYQPFLHTYTVSVEIAALDAYGARGSEELTATLLGGAKWLEEQQRDDGLWSYPQGRVDLSNSQYAVLGIWIAERHGFKAKRETWGRLLKALAGLQNRDGGFGYREGDASTGSMTTAGIAMLSLSLERVADDPRYGSAREKGRSALARAWRWLEEFFTVEGNPNGDRTVIPTHQLYYLFGLERVAAIAGRRKIGEHDWYAEGAERIVGAQRPDGAWLNCDASSFALLFLRRATFTGMRKEGDDEGGGATKDEPVRAKRPQPGVPYLRRWLVCGPIDDSRHSLLDAPYSGDATVDPRVGATFRGRSWSEQGTLGDFVGFGPDARPGDRTLSYAFTWLHVARDVDALLWIGSDDGARLLLDGGEIHGRHVHEQGVRDRSSVPVRLAAGVHRLLVKVENAEGRSGFYLRFASADGAAVPEIRPSLRKGDPEPAATALAMPGLFTPEELRSALPPLPRLRAGFDARAELDWFAYDGVAAGPERGPVHLDVPAAASGHPHPGARGVLQLHPLSREIPARAWFRAAIPDGTPSLRLRVSNDGHGAPGRADFVLRVGLLADAALEWPLERTIGPTPAPDPGGWIDVELPLAAWAGEDALFVLECAGGGIDPWNHESAFFDEIEIR